MSQALRLVIVDDSEEFAITLLRQLHHSGHHTSFRHVWEPEVIASTLAERGWDVIVADYSMPHFRALMVLKLAKALALDVPVVVVSSNLGEDVAVAAMKAGAEDYVLKANLPRVVPAIERALRETGEHRRAAEALRQSEERYRTLFDQNPLPMWVFDVETLRFLAVNEAAVLQYGYSRPEFLGMSIADMRPTDNGVARNDLEVGNRPQFFSAGVWQHRKKDGTLLDVEIHSSPFVFDGRKVRITLSKDVSEAKRLEAQLRQAQKMDAIGQLAGGVAHDFNNLLAVITGCAELLLRALAPDHPGRARVGQILDAADRAASLTKQLLAFSRRQPLRPVIVDVRLLVENMLAMLARLIGEDIQVTATWGNRLGRVRVDPSMLEQVVLNLAVNARDAMPEGGALVFEAHDADLDESYTRSRPDVQPGPYVMLTVSDTGVGMTPDVQSRIFEPFFTTKAQGKGTGLGLATVYGIVKQSGGHISVYSEPGKGTTFKVFLPRADEPATWSPPKPTEASVATAGGTETVLVVEDEVGLRELIREVLEEAGYSVLAPESSEKAVEVGRSHAGPIHLILTDVVMPRLSGREVVNRVRASHPESGALFMSGYTSAAIGQHGLLEPDAWFIQKPFAPSSLLRQVRSALEESER